MSAPPSSSCLTSPGLLLAARVNGDWSRALNAYAMKEKDSGDEWGPQVQVMMDGPYGGCSLDLGLYESILLVAGGSGVSFTLGLLDDIVARCVKLGRREGERTTRIEFAWCTRSFGACLSPP
jgi:ferric-chelate reductase